MAPLTKVRNRTIICAVLFQGRKGNGMKAKRTDRIVEGLKRMGREDSRYDALYRRVYAAFGLAPCATWIFYFLLASEDGLT